MRVKSSKLTLGRYTYQFLEAGSGETLLLGFHGMAAQKEFIKEFLCLGSKELRVVLIDLPGHNGVPYTIEDGEDYIKYIKTLVKHFKPKKYYLLGFSFGGYLALKYTEHSNDKKLKKLIVWASPILGFYDGLKLSARLFCRFVYHLPKPIFKKGQEIVKVLPLLSATGRKFSSNQVRAIANFDKEAWDFMCETKSNTLKISSTDVESLFLYGHNDPLISLENHKHLLGHGFNSKVIQSGGHEYSKEGQRQVVKEVMNFLGAPYASASGTPIH